jgi:hypothetical protein
VQRHVNRRTGRRSSEFYESIFIWRNVKGSEHEPTNHSTQ